MGIFIAAVGRAQRVILLVGAKIFIVKWPAVGLQGKFIGNGQLAFYCFQVVASGSL